jgi:hypothetical protein
MFGSADGFMKVNVNRNHLRSSLKLLGRLNCDIVRIFLVIDCSLLAGIGKAMCPYQPIEFKPNRTDVIHDWPLDNY